jgi:hypothetical protein
MPTNSKTRNPQSGETSNIQKMNTGLSSAKNVLFLPPDPGADDPVCATTHVKLPRTPTHGLLCLFVFDILDLEVFLAVRQSCVFSGRFRSYVPLAVRIFGWGSKSVRLLLGASASTTQHGAKPIMARGLLLCCLFWFPLTLSPTTLRAESTEAVPLGVAWNVQGSWRVEGERGLLLTGDAIPPGSLLQPDASASNHSITVLLPDGQRILDECFTATDCARGFRVPRLESNPDPFAIHLIERIRAALVQQRDRSQLFLAIYSRVARDESAAVLEAGNHLEISGLAATLSDGRYDYDLAPIDSGHRPENNVPIQKAGRFIALTLPGPGLYRLMIIDSLKNLRIDELIAAVLPEQGTKVVDDFDKAQALFEEWGKDYQGWPVHDFQRAYLEALMLHIRPPVDSMRMARATAGFESGHTAEPVFFPKPGVSAGNLAVTLSCATPGAAIHYTIDGSQPFDSSPVYRAPIIMKQIPLRIKAFAESPGKKDSPVVSAMFLVRK